MYGNERGVSRYDASRPLYWDGNIGLMYPSDYGYAAGNACVIGTNLSHYGNFDRGCKNTDWLFNNKSEWLMSPYSSHSIYAFPLFSLGYIDDDTNNANNTFSIRPAFYLKPNTSITSGDGSSTNPYQIALS